MKVPLFKGDLGGSPGLKTLPSPPMFWGEQENKEHPVMIEGILAPSPWQGEGWGGVSRLNGFPNIF